jgi:hypothetical protein
MNKCLSLVHLITMRIRGGEHANGLNWARGEMQLLRAMKHWLIRCLVSLDWAAFA